jgi:hypothetical protein
MTLAPPLPSREQVAERLLRSAARHSLDPAVEVDWAAEPSPGLLWLPEHRATLYGTPLWDRLSPEQRIELTKHEVASQCSTGIWFEASPTVAFAGALFVEELLDAMQREAMKDESVQPLIRQVARVHVVEEARHIAFARAEVERSVAALSRTQLAVTRVVTAGTAYAVLRALVPPGVYRSVGLEPREAYAVREANPHWREAKVDWTRKVVGQLQLHGLLDDALSRRLLSRAGAAPA